MKRYRIKSDHSEFDLYGDDLVINRELFLAHINKQNKQVAMISLIGKTIIVSDEEELEEEAKIRLENAKRILYSTQKRLDDHEKWKNRSFLKKIFNIQ